MTADDIPSTSSKIPLAPSTARFVMGVNAAVKMTEQLAEYGPPEVTYPLFWFYCGAIAAGEHGLTSQEELADFLSGVTVRAPRLPNDPHEEEDEEDED